MRTARPLGLRGVFTNIFYGLLTLWKEKFRDQSDSELWGIVLWASRRSGPGLTASSEWGAKTETWWKCKKTKRGTAKWSDGRFIRWGPRTSALSFISIRSTVAWMFQRGLKSVGLARSSLEPKQLTKLKKKEKRKKEHINFNGSCTANDFTVAPVFIAQICILQSGKITTTLSGRNTGNYKCSRTGRGALWSLMHTFQLRVFFFSAPGS